MVADAARLDKEWKYTGLVVGQRCHLVVVWLSRRVGGGVPKLTTSSVARHTSRSRGQLSWLGGGVGLGCCPSRAVGRLPGL